MWAKYRPYYTIYTIPAQFINPLMQINNEMNFHRSHHQLNPQSALTRKNRHRVEIKNSLIFQKLKWEDKIKARKNNKQPL